MRKYIYIVAALTLALLARYENAIAFTKGAEQECIKCHTLSTEQAVEVMKPFAPDVKILNVLPGPVKGIWEVDFETGGKKNVAYLDYSKKILIVGNLIDTKTKVNYAKERHDELNKIDVSQIPLDNALVMGSKDATHKIVVFDDPEWPYCGKLHQEMKKVLEKRKDIAFYIMLFPLPMHKDAARKSKTIMCEKSLVLLDEAFEKKQIPDPKCQTTVIEDNIKLGQKLGITGTPAMVFPDGRVVPGAMDADSIIKMIDKK